ncbi:MAG: acetyl coenzyme synthetase subunit alpha [Candidatus Peribacteria bacterium]|nr:acetyl coenzyme synthetase subunit alpha [Candidatus Peribacteria bacterium]
MSLLSPASIAVVGASSEEGKVGNYIFKNILTQGYAGALYPVNAKHPEVLGQKAYATVADIPGLVDMAVIVTPAPTVVQIARECGEKNVRTLVVISAGFGELGTKEGKEQEAALGAVCHEYGIQLIGPNCLGILRPSIGLNASFAETLPKTGATALLSQSGAMAVAIMDSSASLQLGFSLVVSMGNKAMMDECDFLEICEQDAETDVIGLYIENIRDGRRFLEIASRVAITKPIVVIKSGVSQRGVHAVSSHTGAMAGSESGIAAVCSQAGIHRAKTTEEFLDILRTLSSQPRLLSPNIAVITNAGGPGILATDAADKEGLILAQLEPKNKTLLQQLLPVAASTENPVDVLGDAKAERYKMALEACGKDPNIDGLVVILTPQIMTPAVAIAKEIISLQTHYPLMPIVTSFMGDAGIQEAQQLLHTHGIPNFSTPERAMHALENLQRRQHKGHEKPARITTERSEKALSLVCSQQGLLSPDITKELFNLYNLPTPEQEVALTVDDAVKIAERIGYPVIAKISSPEILHKTDIGGVRANLQNEFDVRAAYQEILDNVTAYDADVYLQGILIQKFLPAGNEFIVGAASDASFGHLIMIGLGGIYTELFNDVSFRIVPITEVEVYEMLQELKSWKLLLGMRGKSQSDIAALVKIVASISELVTDCPCIRELDLNPVFVDENGTIVLDAKVVVGK